MAKKKQTTDETLTKLAKEHLFIDTLEIRRQDSLDFHEVSVWGCQSST